MLRPILGFPFSRLLTHNKTVYHYTDSIFYPYPWSSKYSLNPCKAERKAMASDVVSFGETMFRLSPPNNVRLEETSVLHVYVAGTESNTLACLSRLNLHTTWISALPQNPLGKHIETALRSHGI